MVLRFIADMLHLSSVIILLLKIRKTRNCTGSFFFEQMFRNFCKNARTLRDCILSAIHGSLLVFCITLQHYDENCLYFVNNLLPLSHKMEEALLRSIFLFLTIIDLREVKGRFRTLHLLASISWHLDITHTYKF